MTDKEKAKKAQESRSKKYKIAIKQGGHITKPSEYANLSDAQFADPVNYRYPIDEQHIRGAITYWAKPKNQEQYSAAEKKVISDRIEKAKKKFKIGEYKKAKDYFIGKSLEIDGSDEIQISKLGVFYHRIYGRFEVTRQDVADMVDNFNLQENDLVIDYEHQTLEGVEAPAAGWMKNLIDKGGDGLWAKVEWTEKARGYFENKEYRYFSPVILYNQIDTKNGESIGTVLHSGALTNVPFIKGMEPLANKEPSIIEKEGKMIEKIKELLGLAADASDDELLEKIQGLLDASQNVEKTASKFKEILKGLGLKEEATDEEISAKLKALKESSDDETVKAITEELDVKKEATVEEIKAKIVALKKSGTQKGFVAKEDFDGLKEKLDKKERDEMVNKAITAGQIGNDEHLEWAKGYALKDPEGFKKWLEHAPIIADPKKVVLGNKDKEHIVVTDEDKEIMSMLDVDEKSFKKHNG